MSESCPHGMRTPDVCYECQAIRAEAAEAKLERAREALREAADRLRKPKHPHSRAESALVIIDAALSDEEPKPNPALSAEPRSTTHHPWLTPDQFYNLGVTELPAAYADLAATVEELERRSGWLPPDEVERRIAKRFSEVLKLYVEDLRGEELDRKVRELVLKDTTRPGAPVGSAPSAEQRLWIDGPYILQGEHEADIGMVGVTLAEVDRRIAEARDEALEEAALLWEYDPGIGAAAIRALKSKKETP